ncbi:DUF4962 domain-containing protein [Candidatus Latescibacterota bacterium]
MKKTTAVKVLSPGSMFFVLILCLAAVIMLNGCGKFEEKPYLWDSQSRTITWEPQADTIELTRARGEYALKDSKSSLRITGTSSGKNFASSALHPMDEFEIYSMVAGIKLKDVQSANSIPAITIQFITSDPKSTLGKAKLEKYEITKNGEWQFLTTQFRSPLGTEQFRITVERDSASLSESPASQSIDLYIDFINIMPAEKYTTHDKYRLTPVPQALNEVRGVHPRIYLTDERIGELRKLIKTTHKPLWEEVRAQADNITRRDPPPYMDENEWKNIEQLYMRPVGNNIPFMALAYVLTEDEKYLKSAVKWAMASCNYETWGLYEFSGIDLATGHQLFGLGILYDWCYDALDEDTRRIIRETIIRRGSYMFDVAAGGRMVKDVEVYRRHPWTQWDEAYLQNHLWDNSCGLSVAGLAIFDEYDDSTRWLAFTLDKYKRTLEVLGDDGASHEGVSYWCYGMEYMLKFLHIARDYLDADLFDHEWLRNTAKFCLYVGIPRNSWTQSNMIVNYGDSPRQSGYGPDYQLRALAGEYSDGHAQWLAGEFDRSNVAHTISRWLNLIWHDPTVPETPPDDLPTMHHFEDIGIVTSRSDWSGDESFIFFKCGPYIGHNAISEMIYDHSSGHHVHPDTNNFMLIGNGEWMIRDDGYWGKYTGYHNTLIIDNGEQLGGGYPAFNGAEPHAVQARPRITRAVSTPEYDHITGDATESYPSASGLQHYIRHMVFLKPDVLLVIDDISLDETRELELRFHPEQQQSERTGDVFFMTGEKNILRLEPLTLEGVGVIDENLVTLPKEALDDSGMLYTVRLQKKNSKWLNVTAFSWSEKDDEPVKISMSKAGGTYSFAAEDRKIEFDVLTGEVLHAE